MILRLHHSHIPNRILMIFKNTKNKHVLLMLLLFSSLCTHPRIASITNGAALTYTSTPMHKGLRVQLAQGYKTHWNKEKKDKARKTILLRPHTLLKENKKLEKSLRKNSPIVTPEWFEKESLNNPLCLLSECNTSYCPLNRSNTTIRKDFENHIVETIKNNLKNFDKKKDVLNYTSFACGLMFPDLIILTKLMAQGFKKININLIDREFNKYIETLKQKEDSSIPLDIFDDNNQKGFWLRHKTYCLIQFLDWFTNDGEISVNIYDSVENYVQECLHNAAMKSDAIVGIDYLEESPWPLLHFHVLLAVTLKKDRYAFSLTGFLMSDESTSMTYKKVTDPSPESINAILNLYSNVNSDEQWDEILKKVYAIHDNTAEIKQLRKIHKIA